MATEVLLAENVEVSYGQIYLTTADMEPPNHEFAFAHQQNGLCGAATPGALLLRTGLQHGSVGMVIELVSHRPHFGDEWEEIVEAGFVCGASPYVLWGPDTESYEVDLPAGRYSVAYCAQGMEAAWAAESNDDDVPLDRYLLVLWPTQGRPTHERIVRQTSAIAQYWHNDNQTTLVDSSFAGSSGQDERAIAQRVADLGLDLNVINELNPTLAQAIACASDELQRSVAQWAALRALSIANLSDDPSFRPAVAQLERGEGLPPPFDDVADTMEAYADRSPQTPVRRVRGLSTEDSEWTVRETAALIAVPLSAAQSPLEAAVGAVTQAAIAYGADEVEGFTRLLYESYPTLRP